MPALLVHMTLARQMIDRPEATGWLAEAAGEARDALLLGSILPDLPYHARFPAQVLRHLAGRDYLLSEWGDLLHTRGTGRLPLAMLAHVTRSHLTTSRRQRVLALTAGYLSHHAVDRVVHPAVNRLVALERRDHGDNEPATRTHERLERYQSLFFHRDLLGHELTGSPYPRRMLQQMAGAGLRRPVLEPGLWRALRAACLETHGRAPAAADVRDWLRGTTQYGWLISSPLGRTERLRGDVDALRRRYYQGPDVDMVAPLERAQQVTASAWHAAEQVLRTDRITSEVRAAFLAEVPDVDLGTGG